MFISLNKEIPAPSLKEIIPLSRIVSKVNSFEEEIAAKPDIFFKDKTVEFRTMIKEKCANLSDDEFSKVANLQLDEILPFYFAMVREAARRTVKMRHFDVQILGGVALHKNKIAEMVTGEGKTLVATLAVSLNALAGRGVHVVTVNDYLAKRDRDWMGPIYEFLGLSCGVIQQDMDKEERRIAYGYDITYGTNNEFGFDYLRDNMVMSAEQIVQHNHFYAVVDEVDSILVDEARTPLIISGPSEVAVDKYYMADKIVRQLKTKFIIQSFDSKDGTVTIKHTDGSEVKMLPQELEDAYDAVVEEKTHNAYLTHKGEKKCEQLLGVGSISEETPDQFSNSWIHYITQALRGRSLFRRDKDYIVKEGEVVIVDEFTGRLMPGRRWSDGLHQGIEAKEGLKIQEESQTLATITLQNYFRMYKKLAGMTGTAYTEANEFRHIYKLDVLTMPTNKTLIRSNFTDRIYKTKKGKFAAVIAEIVELHNRKQPVLVGTTSIEDSEVLSFLLNKKGVPHNVLNAKYHENEAYIVAQTGRLGQITIATNMAGRGTDIILGGNIDYFIKDLLRRNNINPQDASYKQDYDNLYLKHKGKFDQDQKKVIELGGLHIIGTQRHEARRIDNQLRGRSGRQGDPGSSRFYVSLEDDLMRLFGSDKIYFLMDKLGFPENEAIEHPLINRSMGVAQRRVEGHNFEIRKQLLQYDNVMNKQREVVYGQRNQVLKGEMSKEDIFDMVNEVIESNIPGYFQEEPDLLGASHWVKSKFNIDIDSSQISNLGVEETVSFIKDKAKLAYQEKEKTCGQEGMRQMERVAVLLSLDSRWKEHLLIIDSLKEGIHLRGYANTEPLVEYQKETYGAFREMMTAVKESIVDFIFKVKISAPKERKGVFVPSEQELIHSQYSPLGKEQPAQKKTAPKSAEKKVGRNEPCPCGSGKKYKKCCGQ
ncbi:MAG: preprotein translocase subunit SecA [Candidatus Omnitrophota bacterium]